MPRIKELTSEETKKLLVQRVWEWPENVPGAEAFYNRELITLNSKEPVETIMRRTPKQALDYG